VAGETLHETGVTVPAAMTAADVGIDAIIKARDSGPSQDGLCKDFFDFHYSLL
jgi:hypothetical protein